MPCPDDGTKCRKIDICGTDLPEGACAGKTQFCDPDPQDHAKYQCVCNSGYVRVVKDKDQTKVDCKATTVKNFKDVVKCVKRVDLCGLLQAQRMHNGCGSVGMHAHAHTHVQCRKVWHALVHACHEHRRWQCNVTRY